MAKIFPVAPSMHLIEFYARNCFEQEFDSLLKRRGLSGYDRLQIKDVYYEVRSRISSPANQEQEVLA